MEEQVFCNLVVEPRSSYVSKVSESGLDWLQAVAKVEIESLEVSL